MSDEDTEKVFTWSPYTEDLNHDINQEANFQSDKSEKRIKVIRDEKGFFKRDNSNDGKNKGENEKNDFIGSQGQIYSKCTLGTAVGSGMLFHQIEPEESKKQFVLTCAHNFIINNKANTKWYKSKRSTFGFRKSKDVTGTPGYDDKSELDFYIHEKYEKNPLKKDFYNDFAIGICKDDLSKWIKQKNIYIMDLEEANAKKGDIICVAGYPHEKNNTTFQETLYYMEGTIEDIQYNPDDEDEAMIIYKDLITSGGQSGSPVYLKHNDSWVIIGVHIGYSNERNFNRAVGITSAKKSWISKIVDEAMFKIS